VVRDSPSSRVFLSLPISNDHFENDNGSRWTEKAALIAPDFNVQLELGTMKISAASSVLDENRSWPP
jgi:hypothetical protein